jgi:hypothetical protein
MQTSIRISLFSLGAALIGFWPAGAEANAQTDRLVRMTRVWASPVRVPRQLAPWQFNCLRIN